MNKASDLSITKPSGGMNGGPIAPKSKPAPKGLESSSIQQVHDEEDSV